MKAAKPAATFATLSQHRKDAELEAWICTRLKLRDLFAGVTATETRRDRLKVVLLQRELTDSIAGRFESKAITWRALFERLYRTPLTED